MLIQKSKGSYAFDEQKVKNIDRPIEYRLQSIFPNLAAIPSSAAIERFFSTEKDILKPKSSFLELDDLSQMVLFLKCNSK